MRPAPRLAAVLLAAAAASPAWSAPVTVGQSYQVSDRNGNPFTPGPGWFTDLSIRVDGTSTHVRAGLFALDHAPAGATNPTWTAFESFCLQPEVTLTPFSNPYAATALGASRYPSESIAELWGVYRSQVADGTTAAAFQVALWELAYDGGGSLGAGAFRLNTTGAVYDTAQRWLNWLAANDGVQATDLVVLVSGATPDRQDLVTTGRVPVPASFGLVGLGLVGLVAMRRRAGV